MSSSPSFLEPPPEHSGARTALAVGAIIALIAANIYLYVQVDHIRTDMAAVRSTVMSLRDATQVNSASQSRHIDTLKQELDSARTQARSLSSQARADATARAEELAKELQAEQAKAAEEISGVKQASEAASANLTAKIGDVSSDVGTVKTQMRRGILRVRELAKACGEAWLKTAGGGADGATGVGAGAS